MEYGQSQRYIGVDAEAATTRAAGVVKATTEIDGKPPSRASRQASSVPPVAQRIGRSTRQSTSQTGSRTICRISKMRASSRRRFSERKYSAVWTRRSSASVQGCEATKSAGRRKPWRINQAWMRWNLRPSNGCQRSRPNAVML
jgi:hypothetical protein